MDGGGPYGLPEIGDSIQADEPGTLFHVEEEDLQDLEEDGRVRVVEVDLVVAEGGPYQLLTRGGLYRSQERERTGSDDLRKIGTWLDSDEPAGVVGVVRQEASKPGTLS